MPIAWRNRTLSRNLWLMQSCRQHGDNTLAGLSAFEPGNATTFLERCSQPVGELTL
jgi:hypothetical protein